MSGIHVYPLDGGFVVGDKVVDKSARRNGWKDVNGVVIEIDGSMVKVRYDSSVERWKMHINLEKV